MSFKGFRYKKGSDRINTGLNLFKESADDGTRTHTMSPPADFESAASANSATSAYIFVLHQHDYKIISHYFLKSNTFLRKL